MRGKERQHLVRTKKKMFGKWSRGRMLSRGTSVIKAFSEEFVLKGEERVLLWFWKAVWRADKVIG